MTIAPTRSCPWADDGRRLMPILRRRQSGRRAGLDGLCRRDDVDIMRSASKRGRPCIAPRRHSGVGRFAVARDPHGRVHACSKGWAIRPDAAPAGTPGHIGWRDSTPASAKAPSPSIPVCSAGQGRAVDMGPWVSTRLANSWDAVRRHDDQSANCPRLSGFITSTSRPSIAPRPGEDGGGESSTADASPVGSWIVQCPTRRRDVAMMDQTLIDLLSPCLRRRARSPARPGR